MLALVAAADALMLGKLNQDAVAAVSLATQIQFVQNMLLGAIAIGVGILGAQYWGKQCMWAIALPCAFLGAFYFHWPVLVVFACTCLDEVGKIPWVMYHYRKYKWVKNITRS